MRNDIKAKRTIIVIAHRQFFFLLFFHLEFLIMRQFAL